MLHRNLLHLLLALGLAGCSPQSKEAEPAKSAPQAIAVQVSEASLGSIAETLALSGDIHASRETPVAAKVGGRLEMLQVEEGSRVSAGQVIGRIDPYDLKLQVLQAEASLAGAQANRASAETNLAGIRANRATAETNLAKARDNLARMKRLHAEGAISDQQMTATQAQVDAAQNAVRAAEAQVASAQNAIRAAEAQIAQARATIALNQSQIAQTDIKAPFAGTVVKKSAEVGTMLAPMTPVVTLAAINPLELKVAVGQSDLGSVRAGQPASFTVPNYPDRTFTAKVAEVAPTIDPRSRTALVTLRIPNDRGELSPGMFARVALPKAARNDAVLVPAGSVVSQGENDYLYVVAAGKAERRPVEVGVRLPDRIAIKSGLRPGEQVVTLGQGQLQDGDPVTIVRKGTQS